MHFLLFVSGAEAHSLGGHAPSLTQAWSLSPWVVLPLAVLLGLYVTGVFRLWRRAGGGRGISPGEASAFAGGWSALFLAGIWPLDVLGEWSLAAHMAQHLLLLALAPPLLLAGRPAAALAAALPIAAARHLSATLGRLQRRASMAMTPATVAHSAVMWGWHVPAALALALRSDAAHWLMHLCFLLAGLWFWAALWRRMREPVCGVGGAAMAVIAIMVQMGLMGALLTFSPRLLYPEYLVRAPALGLDALQDQQLAGILMWVPASLPYVAGGLWLLWKGLQRLDRRPQGSAGETGPQPSD